VEIVQTGLVLKTENYDECCAFYRDILDLPIIFVEDHDTWNITCFAIGPGYLTVETGGVAAPPQKTFAQSPMKLRLNVSDLDAAVAEIQDRGVALDIQAYDWGRVAELNDPDGNRVALRQQSDVYTLKP